VRSSPSLHGAGDVASNYLNLWQGAADARGFVVIVPDGSCAAGSGNTWCGDDGNAIVSAFLDVGYCYSIDPRASRSARRTSAAPRRSPG
jgi:poly(3-hydroxybutyrate) depolymerase